MAEYRPWTWKVPETSKDMGRTINRQDAFERVSGQAVFTRDVHLPGMLYGKILLSPYPHARIKSIDTSRAEALAGVRDILKYDDPDIEFDNETLPGFQLQPSDPAPNLRILPAPDGCRGCGRYRRNMRPRAAAPENRMGRRTVHP
ncbi:MAG: hypothetical protein P8Y80_00950 [Acidobacteriota bacterium]